jgi:hypothetical protein
MQQKCLQIPGRLGAGVVTIFIKERKNYQTLSFKAIKTNIVKRGRKSQR